MRSHDTLVTPVYPRRTSSALKSRNESITIIGGSHGRTYVCSPDQDRLEVPLDRNFSRPKGSGRTLSSSVTVAPCYRRPTYTHIHLVANFMPA